MSQVAQLRQQFYDALRGSGSHDVPPSAFNPFLRADAKYKMVRTDEDGKVDFAQPCSGMSGGDLINLFDGWASELGGLNNKAEEAAQQAARAAAEQNGGPG